MTVKEEILKNTGEDLNEGLILSGLLGLLGINPAVSMIFQGALGLFKKAALSGPKAEEARNNLKAIVEKNRARLGDKVADEEIKKIDNIKNKAPAVLAQATTPAPVAPIQAAAPVLASRVNESLDEGFLDWLSGVGDLLKNATGNALIAGGVAAIIAKFVKKFGRQPTAQEKVKMQSELDNSRKLQGESEMENKLALYEEMMVNVGKSRGTIWVDYAKNFVNETFVKDFEIYGTETKELYECIFAEDVSLFENVEYSLMSLNEFDYSKLGKDGVSLSDRGRAAGAAGASHVSDRGNAVTAAMKQVEKNVSPTFIGKVKDMFSELGSSLKNYFSNGIGGIISNPLPLVGAGVAVGAVIALIARFKKMSDEKKKKAFAKLSADQKKKAEEILAMPKDELKTKLEAKAASINTEKKAKC